MKTCESSRPRKWLKRLLIILLVFIIANPTVLMPAATVIIYESIFNRRYETLDYMEFSVSDFEDLRVERSDFDSQGQLLAGYKYSGAETAEPKGLVVLAHGLGGGGHNAYMPMINEFVSAGYLVFAYDAAGNDNSTGRVGGLPRGIVALDNAISHAKTLPEYSGLPIVLFGHSWGAFSSANVLNLHPDIRAAALISGFNESEDMLGFYSRSYVGGFADLTMPYLSLYERLKFGKEYTSISALSGFEATEAEILIVHSTDDGTVPPDCGYDDYLLEYSSDPRFTFIEYSDQGHVRLMYSAASDLAAEELNREFEVWLSDNGDREIAEVKAEFMAENLDLVLCFEPDPELVSAIVELYGSACK